MKQLLSIWIIGRNRKSFLSGCIESCRNLSADITYLDTGSSDGSRQEAERLDIPVFDISEETFSEALDRMTKSRNTPWALFLKPDETISMPKNFQLGKALSNSRARGFSLIIEDAVPCEELERYRWTTAVKGCETDMPATHILAIEIRLVRMPFFGRLLHLLMTDSQKDVFPFESNVLKEMRICSPPAAGASGNDMESNRDLQLKLLRGELSCNPAAEDNLDEFSDSYLIYSVLTREDLLRYHRGVEQGFGNERMYLTMLQYLSRFGRFEEAKDFLETWERSWGFFDTSEPYRVAGIVHLNLLEIDAAIASFQKYLEAPHPDYREEALSFLAKCHLLNGDREAVIATLSPLTQIRNDAFDARVLRIVREPDWHPSRLSVCMIVRDEESSLPRALQSIAGIADEIILVDTGSTDGTRKIAADFGCRIFDVPWQDDFSRARNAGIREATGDYILCMDADEFLDPRERLKLALFKQILPADRNLAFRTRIESEEPEEEMLVMLRMPRQSQREHPVRLFPAGRDVYFEGPAFETVERSLAKLDIGVVWNDLFKISHSGSKRPAREKRKRRAVEGAFAFMDVFDIAWKGFVFFLAIGDLKAALPWLEHVEPQDERLAAHVIRLYALHGVHGLDTFLQRVQLRFTSSPDVSVAAADYRASERRYDDVILLLKTFIDTPGAITDRTLKARSQYLYGLALLEQGDLEAGIGHIADARDADPWNARYKAGGIYAMAKVGHWEGVLRALDDMLHEENFSIPVVVHDFTDLGMALLHASRHFQDSGRPGEAELLRRAVEGLISNDGKSAGPQEFLPSGRMN